MKDFSNMSTIDKLGYEAVEHHHEYLYWMHKFKEDSKAGNKTEDAIASCEYCRGYLLGIKNTLELMGYTYSAKVDKYYNVTIIINDKKYTVADRIQILETAINTLRLLRNHASELNVSESSIICDIVDCQERLQKLQKKF